jgi:hypothetical protein
MSFGASPVASTTFQTPSGGGTGSSNANGGSNINSTGADLLILCLSWDGTYTNNGNTFTIADTYNTSAKWKHGTLQNEGQGAATQIWYVEAPSVGANHNVTITTSAGGMFATGEFMAWAGSLNAANTLDVETGNASGAAAPINTGSITPTVNGELIITSWAAENDSSGASVATGYSAPAGAYINTLGNAYGGFSAYQVQSTAASINAVWQYGSGGNGLHAACIASFKPSTGGGSFQPAWGLNATKILDGAFQ